MNNNLLNTQHVETETPVQEISQTIPAVVGNELCDQIDAISVNSDIETFLETIKALTYSSEADRNAVAHWCTQELAALDACIEGQRADGN